MKYSQQLKTGLYVFLAGFVLWFIETAYFGFNMKPINDSELVCDKTTGFVMGIGIYIRFRAVFIFVLNQIKESEK